MKQRGSNPHTCFQTGSDLPSRGDVGSLAPALVSGGHKGSIFFWALSEPLPFFFFVFCLSYLAWPPARPALLAGRGGQGQAVSLQAAMGRQRWVPAANEVDTLIMFSAPLSIPILRQEGDQTWADPSSSHGWRVGRGTPTWQEAEPVWGSPKAPDSPTPRARRNSCHSQPRHREDNMEGGCFVGWRRWTGSLLWAGMRRVGAAGSRRGQARVWANPCRRTSPRPF